MTKEIGLNAYYTHKEPKPHLKEKESLSDYQKRTKESNIDKELANRILSL